MSNRSCINLVGNTTEGQNLGNGCAIYNGKVNTNTLSYKTLSTTGTSIQLFSDNETIYISGASGGGGYWETGSTSGFVKLCSPNGGIEISAMCNIYEGGVSINGTYYDYGNINHDGSNFRIVAGHSANNNNLELFAYGNICMDVSGGNSIIIGQQLKLGGITGCTNSDVLYYNSADGSVSYGASPSGGTTSPAGVDGSIQYNNGSSFGGTNLVWDDSLNHMGWGTSARTDSMLSIMKDTSYDSWTPIMEFLGIDYDGTTEQSQFRVDVQSPSNGSIVRTTCIAGYKCGNLFDETLYINRNSTGNTIINDIYINENAINSFGLGSVVVGGSSTHALHVCSLLKLNPTTTPTSPTTGMVYYDSSANKLKLYNGTAWETVTSSV